MLEQYNELKAKYKDCILLFRLGDFYEGFNDDAKVLSKVLGLTLTGRGQDGNRTPMAGIPYHALHTYLPKLISAGKKVAIADFDGICSGDILVIRSKTKKMLQGLLPYYVSSDAFIQHAVSTSAGSLSPRTKWKDLSTIPISIPDLKTQERILGVLQQLESTVDQLKQQKTTLKNLKQSLLNDVFAN